MRKRISLFLALAIIISLTLTACAGNGAEPDIAEDTVTVTDHNGDAVTLPRDISRIAVCDIFPLPSVLSVFFDSADKIVAMSPTSYSAAENGLLSELYPEIKNADTSAVSGNGASTTSNQRNGITVPKRPFVRRL